jgi:hypothetical protein
MFFLQTMPNMTHFGVLTIHPENAYFGKENILNFEAATAKEQRNYPYLAPKLRYFSQMKRP